MLNALRDHDCRVLLDVRGERREWFLKEKRFGNKSTKIVMCRISSIKKTKGTRLLLDQCPQVIAEEFHRGLSFFYYPENPLFGTELARTYEKDIFVYQSSDGRGYVFYGRLLRALLEVPIVLVCNREYKKIEAKIQHDRDRKAFTNEVLDSLLQSVMPNFAYDAEAITKVLEPWWVKGHKVLSALAKPRDVSRFKFPRNYYARSVVSNRDTADFYARIKSVEEEFQRKKYIQCPAYMAKLGMQSARSVIEMEDTKRKALHSKIHLRKPNKLERQGLEVLTSFISSVHASLADVYATAKYTIGSSDDLLGELRDKRDWQSREVYLSRKIFRSHFARAVSILLHEWAHVHGFDGSRGFTDALTEVIEEIIGRKKDIVKYEREWEKVRSEIQSQDDEADVGIYGYVEQLTSNEKTKLLQSLPEEELMRLLRDTKLDEL